jgi:hypothetical protein
MANAPVVHIGENSQEQVAYKLLDKVLASENHQSWSRKLILDTYAECLDAVTGHRSYKSQD